MRLQGVKKFYSMFGAMCLVHCNLEKWVYRKCTSKIYVVNINTSQNSQYKHNDDP